MSKRQVSTIWEPSFSEPHISLPGPEAQTSPHIMQDRGACFLAPIRLPSNWGSYSPRPSPLSGLVPCFWLTVNKCFMNKCIWILAPLLHLPALGLANVHYDPKSGLVAWLPAIMCTEGKWLNNMSIHLTRHSAANGNDALEDSKATQRHI